jgi:hypothetical protein
MRRYGTMSEKVGLAGNIDMPMRQASSSSAISDDAVPTSDPGDVSWSLHVKAQSSVEADDGAVDLLPFG